MKYIVIAFFLFLPICALSQVESEIQVYSSPITGKNETFIEPANPIYDTKYETNDFVWDRDKTLGFLSNLSPEKLIRTFIHFSSSAKIFVSKAYRFPLKQKGLVK